MLCNNFDKNLGVADVILEIKITRPDEISLSQTHYVDKMIERFKEHENKGNQIIFPTHPLSQEYRNWKAIVGVFSNHRKSNVFNEFY